jgi:hypothetical protein
MPDEVVQGQDGTDANLQDQVPPDSLASPFLSAIPDEDRNVVEKYVKDWDKNVGAKFREIHEQYQPYKGLGEVEEIKAWKQAIDFIQSNPLEAYKNMEKYLRENKLLQDTPAPETPKPPVGNPALGETQKVDTQGLPPEVQKKIEDLENLVKQVSQSYISDKESQKVQEEAKQFDSYLAEMESKHGKFDKDYITYQLANSPNGTDPEKLIQEWVNKYGEPKTPAPRTPPVLTSGAIPGNSTPVKDMSSADVKKLAMAMLPSKE